jgi:hypothetical protein
VRRRTTSPLGRADLVLRRTSPAIESATSTSSNRTEYLGRTGGRRIQCRTSVVGSHLGCCHNSPTRARHRTPTRPRLPSLIRTYEPSEKRLSCPRRRARLHYPGRAARLHIPINAAKRRP